MLALFHEGADRSAIFRDLVNAISHSDGIVYVEFGYCVFGHLNGCLLPFIASSNSSRYLRILVTPDKNRRTHDQLLALIAHELRHALEVLEHTEVVDVETMEAMYRTIGTPLAGQSRGYETSSARAAGDAVLAELKHDVVRKPRDLHLSLCVDEVLLPCSDLAGACYPTDFNKMMNTDTF